MLAAGALYIIVDLRYGAPSLFGARDLQWTQVCWILLPPQVFAYAIPVLGIAGDAVATFAKQRQPQRGVLLGAIGVYGALSFGVYTQPAYDRFAFRQWPYIVQVAILVLPLLALLGAVGTALRKGVRTLAGPLVLALVSVLLLVIGALAAIPFVIGPLDLQSTSAELMRAVPALRLTTAGPPVYTWGVFAIVIVGVAAGAAAGLFHWASKITGRQMPDGLAKLLAPVLLVAGLLFGGPLLVLGFAPKASGLVDAASVLFLLSIVGALLAAVAVAAPVALTVLTRTAVLRGSSPAERDPWGSGPSLEWLTDSPPAEGNFGELPEVTSPEPLLDLNDGGAS
jgi:cytochrome c oxidase subunit 1